MTAFIQRISTPVLLTVAFSTIYFALGPGRFFSVDEVVVEETARAVYSRGDLEVPAMNTAIPGRGDAYYAHRGPALGFVAVPFVLLGDMLQERLARSGRGQLQCRERLLGRCDQRRIIKLVRKSAEARGGFFGLRRFPGARGHEGIHDRRLAAPFGDRSRGLRHESERTNRFATHR